MNKGYCRFKQLPCQIVYLALLFAALLLPLHLHGQTVPTSGMQDNTPRVHAFTNATVVTEPGEVLRNATLVIRDGVIEEVGQDIEPPADARIWDMEEKTLYPGFIDPHSDVGMQNPREELDRGNVSWNDQLRAQLSADEEYEPEEDGSEQLRSQGFTAAMSVPSLGIFRGQTAVMSLGDGSVSDRVIRPDVAHSVKLERSWDMGYGYPTSAIGGIAFIRQTLYDADWYERVHEAWRSDPAGLSRPESNAALEALTDVVNGEQPLLFETQSEEEVLRSLRFTDEFNIVPWIRGSGHEYRIPDVLSEANPSLILPLVYPETPEVESPEDALNVDLATLRHWYLAPENPARVSREGINFSFTAEGLEDSSKFLPNLRKAVHAGLNPETALAALTINPADLLGISETHGTLEAGKTANIVIANGDLFEQEAKILDVWIDGERYRINPEHGLDPRGEWRISSSGILSETVIAVEGSIGSLNGTINIEDEEIEFESVTVADQARRFRVAFSGEDIDMEGIIRLTASVSGDEMYGWAELPGGERVQWSAGRTSGGEEDEIESPEFPERDLQLSDVRPAMAYGRESMPDQPESVFIQNATIWTMGDQGRIEDADLLIQNGRVAEVGQNISAPDNSVVIDAEGKHVTPGLIDPHIHSGTDGVNEIGNAIVPEVRIGDVLNINNIWMYRQVAGGLTTAHVMHGSANPIGGQNQHIKMRWGALPEELKFEDAPSTVKFALGENPKRVGTDRYPETRMGTNNIIEDRFAMARDYQDRWNEWNETEEGLPPRKDLRLDALVDILEGDILVQSHSYRQDEILALMRLAEKFDITIKAFHHAVEAYKVAPELLEHGAGAVVWSDWGSFKIEAYDATLYNARLLSEAGVLTSLHSDNSQIASRMNWEAAKMVHAGMEPVDALALVTINTAKILGIEDRVGSLEEGKDADFVIWSGDPLSTFTKAEQTWIDGRKYFDLEEDARMRDEIEEERAELIQKILEANS